MDEKDPARRGALALFAIGHDATFSEVMSAIGAAPSNTRAANEALKAAQQKGWARSMGPQGRKGNRWTLTDQGRLALSTKPVAVSRTPEREVASARETILMILEKGEAADDKELMGQMAGVSQSWRQLGMHSLDHQLFSMEKAGLIEMDVKRNGRVQAITRIRLPKRATRAETEWYNGNAPEPTGEAEKDTIEQVSIVQVVPQAVLDDAAPFREAVDDVMLHRYPVLDRLRERERLASETRARADAFLAAASALDGVAQEESDRLMALASEISEGASLTAVEAEYLRYVGDQPDNDQVRDLVRMAELANSYLTIVTCKQCDLPIVSGYVCSCGYDGSDKE